MWRILKMPGLGLEGTPLPDGIPALREVRWYFKTDLQGFVNDLDS